MDKQELEQLKSVSAAAKFPIKAKFSSDNFDDLTDEEKQYWQDKVDNLSELDMIHYGFMRAKKCVLGCKAKFPNGIVKDGFPTPEFAVHAYTTHGIPFELLLDIWMGRISVKKLLKKFVK